MVVHALWDFGTFTHMAGKTAGTVAAQTDIPTGAAASGLQSLLMLAAIVLVIIGAKKILKPRGDRTGAGRSARRVTPPAFGN